MDCATCEATFRSFRPLASSEHELLQLIEAIIDVAKNYQLSIAVDLDFTEKDQTADM